MTRVCVLSRRSRRRARTTGTIRSGSRRAIRRRASSKSTRSSRTTASRSSRWLRAARAARRPPASPTTSTPIARPTRTSASAASRPRRPAPPRRAPRPPCPLWPPRPRPTADCHSHQRPCPLAPLHSSSRPAHHRSAVRYAFIFCFLLKKKYLTCISKHRTVLPYYRVAHTNHCHTVRTEQHHHDVQCKGHPPGPSVRYFFLPMNFMINLLILSDKKLFSREKY